MTSRDREGEVPSSRITQLPIAPQVAAISWKTPWRPVLWLAMVVYGCLSTIGVSYSTVLAQSVSAVFPALVVVSRKKSNADGSIPGDPNSPNGCDARPIAASYSRFSSDLQKDSSIEDQRRSCRVCADKEGFQLPEEFEYADYAISGTKLQRDGLDRLLEDAKHRRFDLLIMFSLSRLARESVIGMPILKMLVFEYGIRIISVSESIDSDNPSWDMMATMYMLQHENYVKELGKNVLRGQEGAVLSGFSVGDYRFGYRTVPSPSGEMIGRGRNAKPRMVYQIDLEQAQWVKHIFGWFVGERRSIAWITGELNRRNAPKDHRSTTVQWHHALVIGVLTSPKYIGQWTWGLKRNKRLPSSGKVIQEARPESETAPWNRELPELRIIPDDVFFAAQERRRKSVEQNAGKRDAKGHLNGKTFKRNYQHLLAGLFKCKLCGSTFHTTGVRAKYMGCRGYKSRVCTCRTMLPRQLAEKLILEAIGNEIKANSLWKEQIVELTQKAIESAEETDDANVSARLAQRRREKEELVRQLRGLEREKTSEPRGSVAEWVEEQIGNLFEVLTSATPAATESLHNLLVGPIVLEVVPHDDRTRCHFRGTFRIRVGRLTIGRGSEIPGIELETTENGDLLKPITIEFRERTRTELQGEIAWKMLQELRPIKEIAEVLQVSRARTTAILKIAAAERGEPLMDGRTRRSTLPDSTRPPTIRDLKSDEILKMYHADVLLGDIAATLGIDSHTVTAAITKWHERQGLQAPDGRTRRKSLEVKSSSTKSHEPDASPRLA
jgi:site-specific DNA recombinase